MADATYEVHANEGAKAGVARIDMKLEVVVIPISDVDRAKEFYERIGWRLDIDRSSGEDFRLVQFTPPGSSCSVHFGKNVTSAAPGSATAFLVVPDIVAARGKLVAAAVKVGEFFHDGPEGRGSGLHPERLSHRSRALFSDPDGNGWQLEDAPTRLPRRFGPGTTSFDSASNLASAFRRAEAAHGEHEKRIGQRDANWPDWYTAYMVYDFQQLLGSAFELIRFRDGSGSALLNLHKPKAPRLVKVQNSAPEPVEMQSDSGYRGVALHAAKTSAGLQGQDVQVIDTSAAARILTTVTNVTRQASRQETGTIFLLGDHGLTMIRRPGVEWEYVQEEGANAD